MKVKLSAEQMQVVKDTADICGRFADQVYHIIRNHGLDEIKGCHFSISVDPEFDLSTEVITIGTSDSPFGKMTMMKGSRFKNGVFEPVGRNSYEYELLFADEATRSKMQKAVQKEKPLPPDGLWISVFERDDPVDCGEPVNG